MVSVLYKLQGLGGLSEEAANGTESQVTGPSLYLEVGWEMRGAGQLYT